MCTLVGVVKVVLLDEFFGEEDEVLKFGHDFEPVVNVLSGLQSFVGVFDLVKGVAAVVLDGDVHFEGALVIVNLLGRLPIRPSC